MSITSAVHCVSQTRSAFQRRSSLFRAVLATVGVIAFTAGEAQGVYLDPDGKGQALIFPYYTAQSVGSAAFNTYISLINNEAGAKVLRVRFREGRNAREVAAFNLYLGGGDLWTAAVVPDGQGTRLVTADLSCMNGPFPAGQGSSFTFSSLDYTEANGDGLGSGLDRTREGYIEVIEMASLVGQSQMDVTPVSEGAAPPNCAAVQGATVNLQLDAPRGGLSGRVTLINVLNGMDFTMPADALAALTSQPFYRDFNDPYPDFNSTEVTPLSHFFVNGRSYRATWASGVDAVGSVLSKRSISNETILDSGSNSHTEWVVTLPMRRFYATRYGNPPQAYPAAPLAGLPYRLEWRARDGGAAILIDACGVLCPPATFEVSPRLPWAANVVTFARGSGASSENISVSEVLGSTNATRLTLPSAAAGGFGVMDFAGQGPTFALQTATSISIADGTVSQSVGSIRGVQALGFMVRTFQNGFLSCGSVACQGNYGGSFPHIGRASAVE